MSEAGGGAAGGRLRAVTSHNQALFRASQQAGWPSAAACTTLSVAPVRHDLLPRRLLNPLAAILISVTAILIFAEIMPQVRRVAGMLAMALACGCRPCKPSATHTCCCLPHWHAFTCLRMSHQGLPLPPCSAQAVCKRYGLEIGAYCSWLVRLLMWITFPVSWPLGKVSGGCTKGLLLGTVGTWRSWLFGSRGCGALEGGSCPAAAG